MQNLIKQEQLELEVLDKLNSSRLLSNLVFGGGTMLRLCHGLERFSVDLDFWVTKNLNFIRLFKEINDCLSSQYIIKDSASKYHTLLYEIKSKEYPRSLKIEIRKKKKKIMVQHSIAYSKNSNLQVLLNTVALPDMMKAKIEAFLKRREIRDAFDMEFMLKRGIGLNIPAAMAKKLLKEIDALNKNDYRVKLGSLLEAGLRQYYSKENFKILRAAVQGIINER